MAQENPIRNIDIDSVYHSSALDIQAMPPSDLISEIQTLITDSDCACKATVYYFLTVSSTGKVDEVKIMWGDNICWASLVMKYLEISEGWIPGYINDIPVHSRFIFPLKTVSPYWEPCE